MNLIDWVKNKVYTVDCRIGLNQLKDDSVDCFISSPPYFVVRDFGIEPIIWDEDPNCEHEWSNPKTDWNYTGGTTKYLGQFKDNKTHHKSEASFCLKCWAWLGCLGLEPDVELFVKHLCDVYDIVKKKMKPTGTCWVNLSDNYINKCAVLGPERFAIEMCNRGWILRSKIIWYKPNAMPCSAKDRPPLDWEVIYLFTKTEDYFFDREAIREAIADTYVNLSRRKYKPGDGTQGRYAKSDKEFSMGEVEDQYWSDGKYKRCVWGIWGVNTKASPVKHYATYPPELIEPMVKAGCPKGGVVCDPFGGIGTTVDVCIEHGRDWIIFEMSKENCDNANRLIEAKIDEFNTKQAVGQGDYLML